MLRYSGANQDALYQTVRAQPGALYRATVRVRGRVSPGNMTFLLVSCVRPDGKVIDAGTIDRFGFIEETDGGETYRYAGIFDWQTSGANSTTRLTGYTQRYGVHRLVHYEMHGDMEHAIQREKRLKKWNRVWKLRLIEEGNPEWRDLWEEILGSTGSQPAPR